jgi:peroxiredoxin
MKLPAFAFALWFLTAPPASAAVVEIDQPAPPLRGTLLSGQPFDLKDMRGKVVLVNFYSSYCSFCAYEIGNLETFYERYRDKGFEVIVIGIDNLEDRPRVERALTNYGLQGAMADELAESGFERRYPTPTAYVIDREGIVRSRYRGSKQPAYFANHVLPLLQER